ncbi:MAG: class I fructose-bisphosphate aldolase [Patescibacteria group bacterium]
MSDIEQTAKMLVAPGKGLLAADESFSTIEKRFESLGIPLTQATRLSYRELLFTPAGIENFLSGVILFDETLRQKTTQGKLFVEVLEERGIIPGIKVDEGLERLPGSPNEKITKGLPGLEGRLKEYKNLGARFTKWRCVFVIGDGLPSQNAINKNAEVLTNYCLLSQRVGLTPIPEPEVLMDGNHSIEKCRQVSTLVLKTVFLSLKKGNVSLEGILLKTNMVLPGRDNPKRATPNEVAAATIEALKASVPPEVTGIVFLSGGQAPKEATANLNAINYNEECPWELSFSFSRALQQPVLETWQGKEENIAKTQSIFYKRARLNSLARDGHYTPEMENE